MSRHIVSNQGELAQIIGNLFTTDSRNPHRTLIVIESAPPGWLEEYVQKAQIQFISSETTADRADKISALLGREHQILAHSLQDPMDAGLLAALAGTVTHEGVLLISLPYRIPSPNDPHDLASLPPSLFGARFTRLLDTIEKEHSKEIVLLRGLDDQPPTDGPQLPPRAISQIEHLDARSLAREEQDTLLAQASDFLTRTDRACLCIVGKRGRGKTSLLARIANQLNTTPTSYTITALNKSAISTFYKQTDHAGERQFQTAAEIQPRDNHVVLVDEAANLPISVLTALIRTHQKIVFCTTVEGYESAGRAFQNRFSRQLAEAFENTLTLEPQCPWRWLENDPIENLIDRVVLNTASDRRTDERENPTPTSFADIGDHQVVQITQQSLSESEAELDEVYSLLRDTHYQTNVKDLQHLLDGQDLQIWGLRHISRKALLAVALVSIEQKIEPSIHRAIVEKKRRLPHHLLAQLLAQSANTAKPLSKIFARVTRISVDQNYRRVGLGSILLRHIEQALLSSENDDATVDAIGASFTKDPISVEFWRSNGYTEIHEGFRKNPRTALPSSAVLKTEKTDLKEVISAAAEIHEDNQFWRQRNASDSDNQSKSVSGQVTDTDQALLVQFIQGHRSAHDTFAAISRLKIQKNLSFNVKSDQSQRAQENELRQQVAKVMGTGKDIT